MRAKLVDPPCAEGRVNDLGALSGQTSLYFSAIVSLPFVPGHEVVAELLEDCEDLAAGPRLQ